LIRVDTLIVGSGPAGMAAAIEARRHDLDVIVIDDQPGPGGQIWRSIEMPNRPEDILGPSYSEGHAIAEAFRTSGARLLPSAKLIQIDSGYRAYVIENGKAKTIMADTVVLATGAQERPTPFPGWTLPGVMTVGAAQIMLKNASQIPTVPVWIAGSGPLPLLYAVQLLRAGGQIAGYLDTTPAGQWRDALRHFPQALRATEYLLKGLAWTTELRRRRVPRLRGVVDIEALGTNRIESLRYTKNNGKIETSSAELLLVHEGVVPSIHQPLSLDCDISWDPAQDCFSPCVDSWGESTQPNLFIVGDGAGIAGAKAAVYRGELAAIRMATRLDRIDHDEAKTRAGTIRKKLNHEMAARPFLDALFRPREQVFLPTDDTIVCRCEEVTAKEIKEMAIVGRPGPNQIKAATRAGMGPCQGRQCGYTVSRIIGDAQSRSPSDVGFFHVRPPLKPVTLGELASFEDAPMA
jgi:octopine oxidase subunit A